MTNPSSLESRAIPPSALDVPAAWKVADIKADDGWVYQLDPDAADELIGVVRRGRVPGKPLFDYRRRDFPLSISLPLLAAAFAEIRDGRGMALVRGLPRDGLSMEEFELMTWAIGLYFGVARPQNLASAYIERVKDMGGEYRSPTGRGYSSNAELDFHVDGSDVVLLSCYNRAKEGGMSMCTSGITAYKVIQAERPDLAEVLRTGYPFSRNGEQDPGEPGWYYRPIIGIEDGHVCVAWNRNRFKNALEIPGVPPVTDLQREAVDYLDAVLRRSDLMYCMQLEPGDMQMLSNLSILHSRTSFQDYEDEDRRRTLYRLWLATPDSRRLPPGWEDHSGTREGGSVRGGILGRQHDDARRRFDREQAADLGMTVPF